MAESTLEAPTIPAPATADPAVPREPVPWTLRAYLREHPWWSTTAVIVVISAMLVVWARTRPSYDAYGWLVWGYQTLRLTLDLGGAPSWKPMPFLFTVPYALFGHYQLWLWMIDRDRGGAGGRGVRGPDRVPAERRRRAAPRSRPDPALRPYVAAVFAGAAVLGTRGLLPLHPELAVGPDDRHVRAGGDRHGPDRPLPLALLFGVLAALGRPEVWPFLGLFMLWAWFKMPGMRWMLVAGVA